MMRSLLTAAALVLTVPMQAQSLEQVVTRHLKAQGSPEAMKALKTLRLTMKMTAGPGMEFPMTVTTVFPAKIRTDMTMMGQASTVVINGKQSWWVQPMMGKTEPEPLPEAMLSEMEGQARQFQSPLIDYKAKGHTLELVGKEKAEEGEAYHLRLTMKAEKPMDLFLDAETYLLTRMSLSKEAMGQKMDVTVRMGDYKPVAGILMAHSIETKIAAMPAMSPKMVIEKAEPNVAVDEAIFAMPAKKAAPAPAATPAAK